MRELPIIPSHGTLLTKLSLPQFTLLGEVKAFAFVKVSLKLHCCFREMFESWSSQALLWNLHISWESHMCVCIKYACESISVWFLILNLYFCYSSSSWEFRRMKEIRFSSLQVTGCKIKSDFLKLHSQHLQVLIWPNFFFMNTTQMNSKSTPWLLWFTNIWKRSYFLLCLSFLSVTWKLDPS